MHAPIVVNSIKQRLTLANVLMLHVAPLLPGLVLSAVVAGVSIQLGKVAWLASHGLSALTIAIVLGIVLGNTIFPRLASHCSAGVVFSKQNPLRSPGF